MKFALNENTINQCDLIEFINASADAGFKAVELSYPKLKEILRFVSAETIRKICNDRDIEILDLGSLENAFLVPETGVKALEYEVRLMAELASSIGCSLIAAPTGTWNIKYGSLPKQKYLTSIYRKRMLLCKSTIEEYGLKLAFEPIAYPEFVVGDLTWVRKILDIPEFHDVSIIPDVHNLYINGEGPEQLILAKDRIPVFHICDTINAPKESLHVGHSRCFPGYGIADAEAWVAKADSLGYRGYYSLELFDNSIWEMDPPKAALLCMNKLRQFERLLNN